MNVRNVLRTYSLLRQLTDNESALLNTLRAMNDSERELLVESLSPTKGTGKGVKKAGKKGAASSGNSRRGLPQSEQRCSYVYPDDGRPYAGTPCTAERGNAIHNKEFEYAGYHPFSPLAAPTTAPRARGQSSPNGAEQRPTVSSETGTGDALDAARAAGGE